MLFHLYRKVSFHYNPDNKKKVVLPPPFFIHIKRNIAGIRTTFFLYACLSCFHQKPSILCYQISLSDSSGVWFGLWLKNKLISHEAREWSIRLFSMFINQTCFVKYMSCLVNRCKKLLEISWISVNFISVTKPKM